MSSRGFVCVVLALMQSKRIAHCDLSLENVMLTTTGQVKVIDFALCVSAMPDGLSPELVARAAAGKAAYVSPEVCARLLFLMRHS